MKNNTPQAVKIYYLTENIVPFGSDVTLSNEVRSSLNKKIKEIISDNRHKPGIYRWVNKVNNKSYIGSSSSLTNRLKYYWSEKSLKNKNLIVNRAILKYGIANFNLEILIYCDKKDLATQEQYFIRKFRPAYNIKLNNKAWTLSTATKQRMSLVQQNRSKSPVSGIPVKIHDLVKNETNVYSTVNEASLALNVNKGTISRIINRNNSKPYKKRYVITKLL
jgi:GIY-YIG catalytic domain/NUMOD1 domain